MPTPWPLRFGAFYAPFHPVGQNPTLALERDLELVQRLDQELGVTSVMVTHDVRGAFRVANRLALLSEGKVVMQGTPQEFLASDNPKVKAFLERDFDNTQFAA